MRYFLGAMLILSLMPFAALAEDTSSEDSGDAVIFAQFIIDIKAEARGRGVSEVHLALLDGIAPLAEVVRLASRQPEYIRPIWEYLDHMITARRLELGREQLVQYGEFLNRLDSRYGVPAEVLASIWGVETNFGSYRGTFSVLGALATLGYQGRRAAFGKQQLLAALQILEAGDVGADEFTGSWAGAMGHPQFIPTTYLGYAVDGTGDGKRDIWNSPEDALASAANYLKVSGWKPGLRWGVEVRLPEGFNYEEAGLKNRHSIDYWRGWGIQEKNGRALSKSLGKSALFLPAGYAGPAFLVTQNFFAILRYNTAPAYGLAIGYLSDQLAGHPAPAIDWPLEARPLHPAEVREMQELLDRSGYKISRIDGIPGRETRRAVRAFQIKNHLTADGYATPTLLEKMRDLVRTGVASTK